MLSRIKNIPRASKILCVFTLVMMIVGSKKMMCWSSYSLMAEWSLAYIGSRFLESAVPGMETLGMGM